MKKNLVIALAVMIFVVASVSAFWPFDSGITGNLIYVDDPKELFDVGEELSARFDVDGFQYQVYIASVNEDSGATIYLGQVIDDKAYDSEIKYIEYGQKIVYGNVEITLRDIKERFMARELVTLQVEDNSDFHFADINQDKIISRRELDFAIKLYEADQIDLTTNERVIQFYNLGGYKVKEGTEDGFAPVVRDDSAPISDEPISDEVTYQGVLEMLGRCEIGNGNGISIIRNRSSPYIPEYSDCESYCYDSREGFDYPIQKYSIGEFRKVSYVIEDSFGNKDYEFSGYTGIGNNFIDFTPGIKIQCGFYDNEKCSNSTLGGQKALEFQESLNSQGVEGTITDFMLEMDCICCSAP